MCAGADQYRQDLLCGDRMLGHASGMIGFPLRLLARENYDKIVARIGASQVALITARKKSFLLMRAISVARSGDAA